MKIYDGTCPNISGNCIKYGYKISPQHTHIFLGNGVIGAKISWRINNRLIKDIFFDGCYHGHVF